MLIAEENPRTYAERHSKRSRRFSLAWHKRDMNIVYKI
jgi:hypothetical protein